MVGPPPPAMAGFIPAIHGLRFGIEHRFTSPLAGEVAPEARVRGRRAGKITPAAPRPPIPSFRRRPESRFIRDAGRLEQTPRRQFFHLDPGLRRGDEVGQYRSPPASRTGDNSPTYPRFWRVPHNHLIRALRGRVRIRPVHGARSGACSRGRFGPVLGSGGCPQGSSVGTTTGRGHAHLKGGRPAPNRPQRGRRRR